MSVGASTMYLAWGANIALPTIGDQEKAERRSEGAKVVTTSYVNGPGFRVDETNMVSFGVFVTVKDVAAHLLFKVEHSYDGVNWAPQSAGLALAAVGVAPDQEAQSEILPFVKKWLIPTLAADQQIFFNYEQRAGFTRIAVKCDAGVPEIFIQAGV